MDLCLGDSSQKRGWSGLDPRGWGCEEGNLQRKNRRATLNRPCSSIEGSLLLRKKTRIQPAEKGVLQAVRGHVHHSLRPYPVFPSVRVYPEISPAVRLGFQLELLEFLLIKKKKSDFLVSSQDRRSGTSRLSL